MNPRASSGLYSAASCGELIPQEIRNIRFTCTKLKTKSEAMKNSRLSNVRWWRVLLTGIVVYTLSYCIIFLVITAYGFILAFQARGAPDQDQIQQFASQVSPWGVPALALLLTFGAAVWVSRKVIIATSLHGLFVGLIVAIINVIVSLIFGWAMNLLDLMWFFLIIAAGWFGGFLYSRGR